MVVVDDPRILRAVPLLLGKRRSTVYAGPVACLEQEYSLPYSTTLYSYSDVLDRHRRSLVLFAGYIRHHRRRSMITVVPVDPRHGRSVCSAREQSDPFFSAAMTPEPSMLKKFVQRWRGFGSASDAAHVLRLIFLINSQVFPSIYRHV